jgi:hydroxypyruvate reductase
MASRERDKRDVKPQFEQHRHHLAALRAAALRAVDPYRAVKGNLSAQDLAPFERVFIAGAGKAGLAMAHAAAEIAGHKLAGGAVAVPRLPSPGGRGSRFAYGGEGEPVQFIEGGHPLPGEGSLAAGRAIAELLAHTTPRDLVLALISGGGSALMELPKAGLSLSDLQTTNHQLLKSGATIHEFNTVRRALSQIKGGGLLRLAHPAQVLGLILSDVVGNDLSIIASGPTVAADVIADVADGLRRTTTLAIVEKYQLQSALPPHVLTTLQHESVTSVPESAAENRLIASNRLAGEAAAQAARELGFAAEFLGDDWQGEAREVGQRFAERLTSPPAPSPLSRRELPSGEGGRGVRAVIAGGESTVTVRGPGKGGRNQEVALAAAIAIEGQPNLVISTFATDGVDGPTDAAGATVTGQTVARARALGLDLQTYLDNNDAYTFFAALGDLVLAGPTGTNVNDLLFGLAY